jgi:hypothetical protein
MRRCLIVCLLLSLFGGSADAQKIQPLQPLRDGERIRFATSDGWVEARFAWFAPDTLMVLLHGQAAAVPLGAVAVLHAQRKLPAAQKVPMRPSWDDLHRLVIVPVRLPLMGFTGGMVTGMSLGATAGYALGGTAGVEHGFSLGAILIGAAGTVVGTSWAVRMWREGEWYAVPLPGQSLAAAVPLPEGPFRDPAAARLAALLVPGGGYFYTGEWLRGYVAGGLFLTALTAGAAMSPNDGQYIIWSEAKPLAYGAALSLLPWAYGVAAADNSAARVNARNGFTRSAALQVQPRIGISPSGDATVGFAIIF